MSSSNEGDGRAGGQPPSFQQDIRPLFRQKDIDAMKSFGRFDLADYQDNVDNAENNLSRLKKGDMPCDGAWPPEHVQLYEDWRDGGYPP